MSRAQKGVSRFLPLAKKYGLLLGLLAFLLTPLDLFALTCACNADGNWSAAGTWTACGGGVPGDGDIITIGSGCDVTMDGSRTIGTSPAEGGTKAIDIADGGTLTLSSGTLTLRGPAEIGNNTEPACGFVMNAGTSLVFDASLAADPTNQQYAFSVGDSSFDVSGCIKLNGTSGSQINISSNSSGGNGWFNDGAALRQAFQIDADYVNFTRCGDATNPCMRIAGAEIPSSADGGGDDGLDADNAGLVRIKHSVFQDCGLVDIRRNVDDDAHVELQFNAFHSGEHATLDLDIDNAGENIDVGVRNVSNNAFEKGASFVGPDGFTIEDNVFQVAPTLTYASLGVWVSFDGNLHRKTSAGATNIYGHYTNNYLLLDHATANPHGISPYAQNLDSNITDNIGYYTGTDDAGDFVVLNSNPASAKTLQFKRNIVLPNADGEPSGTCITFGGGANVTAEIEHNTCTGHANANISGSAVGETYAGHAAMLSYFRCNLFPGTAGSTSYYKLFDSGTDNEVSGLVAAANCVDNGCEACAAGDGASGTGYNNLEFASGTCGSGDVDQDPGPDGTSCQMGDWDAYNGGAGTVANALTEMLKMNDRAGFNTAYSIATLLTWTRSCMAPTNAAFDGACDADGGDIGAVNYAAPAATTTVRMLMGVGS